jgi:lysozyme
MHTNFRGIRIIRESEGLRLKAYQDSGSIWTVGVGHTRGVQPNEVISWECAKSFFWQDIGEAEKAVKTLVRTPLNANQFSALVSFVFNLGSGKLKTSTLLKKLNGGDVKGAAAEFSRWVYGSVKGEMVKLPGLVKRRERERKLFLS